MSHRTRRNRTRFGWMLIVFSFILVGCSAERWSPTDPRIEDPDAQPTPVVVERVEINIGTSVTP